MPYTKQVSRNETLEVGPQNVGDLTFLFYKIALEYTATKGLKFQTIADVRAALASTLSEFDRRVGFPYEDKKIAENGDVLPQAHNPELLKILIGITKGE